MDGRKQQKTMMKLPQIEPNTILMGYRGSHAHGTYIDPEQNPEFGTDDIDLMGVVVPPESYYLGLDTYGSRGTKEISQGPYDIVYYELRKFVSLLCKGNPNVIGLLWLESPEYGIVRQSMPGLSLVSHTKTFTFTKQTVKSFYGYALSQKHQMQKNPTHRAYMGERRKALAEKFGYDVKHASHLLRLLWMLVELLETEHFTVRLSDAKVKDLIAIKRGDWLLSDVLNETSMALERARELEAKCDWPDRVDEKWASGLCVDIVKQAWNSRNFLSEPTTPIAMSVDSDDSASTPESS
jgi:predicted nucleotidyltransferase